MVLDQAAAFKLGGTQHHVIEHIEECAAGIGGYGQSGGVISEDIHRNGVVVRAERPDGYMIQACADGACAAVDVEGYLVGINVPPASACGADPGFALALDDDDHLFARGLHRFYDAVHRNLLRQVRGCAAHEQQILRAVAAAQRIAVRQHEERACGFKGARSLRQSHVDHDGKFDQTVCGAGQRHGPEIIGSLDAFRRFGGKPVKHIVDEVVRVIGVALFKEHRPVGAVCEVQGVCIIPPKGVLIGDDAVDRRIHAGHHLEELHHHALVIGNEQVILPVDQGGRVRGPHGRRCIVCAHAFVEAQTRAVVDRRHIAIRTKEDQVQVRIFARRLILHRYNTGFLIEDAAPKLVHRNVERGYVRAGHIGDIRAETIHIGRDDHRAVDVVVHALIDGRKQGF